MITHLSTNSIEQNHAPAKGGDLFIYFSDYNNLNRGEKWVTTYVSKETVLSFDWLGDRFNVTNSIPVSTNTVHLRIKQDWEEVKP